MRLVLSVFVSRSDALSADVLFGNMTSAPTWMLPDVIVSLMSFGCTPMNRAAKWTLNCSSGKSVTSPAIVRVTLITNL